MRQFTAETVAEVHEWVETNAHHICEIQDATPRRPPMVVLTGHGVRLRVPQPLWINANCGLGHRFDTRMYRKPIARVEQMLRTAETIDDAKRIVGPRDIGERLMLERMWRALR